MYVCLGWRRGNDCFSRVYRCVIAVEWLNYLVCGSYSKYVQLREITLTVCLYVSAACSNLSASPYTSSAARPGERGIPLPLHPTRPQTFYCTATEVRGKCHNISQTGTFSSLADTALHLTGSSFLCLQLYFLLGSSVLGRSMWDCFSMASNKICLLASRRQSKPSKVRSEWDAHEYY